MFRPWVPKVIYTNKWSYTNLVYLGLFLMGFLKKRKRALKHAVQGNTSNLRKWKFSEGRQESIFYQLPKWFKEQPDVRMVPQMMSTLIPQDGGWGETKVERCLYFYTQYLHPIKFWSFLYDLVLIISPSRQGSKKNATQLTVLLREDETQLEYFLKISSFTEIFGNYSSDKKKKTSWKNEKIWILKERPTVTMVFLHSHIFERDFSANHLYLAPMCVHAQPRPTLCNSPDCNLPGAFGHGILQTRILEWDAISFSTAYLLFST